MQLRKLIYNSEYDELITYLDNCDIYGRNLVWSHVNRHLNEGKSVHYLCYSICPKLCCEKLNKDGSKKLLLYDLYTDPLCWELESSSKPYARKELSSILKLSSSEAEKEVVVIDKISCALNYVHETTFLHSLMNVKNAESVSQVIVYCSQDTVSPSFVSSLTNLSQCVISLNATSPTSCNILSKRKSGKVVKTIEEFGVSDVFTLEYARERKPTSSSLCSSSTGSEDLVFETTFNLSLTQDQKEARDKLILPHTRIQTSGGQIHYVPEAEDDWDDEDPDEDLEI